MEINTAVESLPTNKSPGPDGFIGEYYKSFKQILSPHLVRLFNDAVASSSFPSEMLKALIITIHKPGKDLSTSQNFDPSPFSISILNDMLNLLCSV